MTRERGHSPTGNRGAPLVNRQGNVQPIAATIAKTGRCELAPAMYPAGVKDCGYVIFKAAM
jgi:hypothetical protein